MFARLLLVLSLCAPFIIAADLHMEGATSIDYGLTEKWTGTFYARGRVNTRNGRWYDFSAMPAVSYQAHPAIEISGGAFITRLDEEGEPRANVVRTFIAATPELSRGRVTVGTRFRGERIMLTGGLPDFSRYRQRFKIERDGNWAPYAYLEVYFTAEGFTRTRYSAGVEKRVIRNHTLDFAYFYESHRFLDGGLRHMIRTTFRFDFPHHDTGD